LTRNEGKETFAVPVQSRTITRLREALLSLFSALERALGLNSTKAPLILLTHYQTPTRLKRAGHKRIASYPRNRGVKGSNKVAHKAFAAARSQRVTLPAQDVAASIVAELAEDVLGLKERINTLDEDLEKRFFIRPEARILTSLPGMGPILGAEFLVSVGDICAFSSADRLAAYAGLCPGGP
jgi:transposase